MDTTLGPLIERLRTTLGLSRAKFGRLIGDDGVDQMTVYHWERSGRIPDEDNMAAIEDLAASRGIAVEWPEIERKPIHGDAA